MAVIYTLGADVLKANVEARQAEHDLRTNVNKLGVRKGAEQAPKASRAKKSKQASE